MIDQIFKKLDRDNKGYIGYQDFCEMAEEKRRNIDPYTEDISPKKSPLNKT